MASLALAMFLFRVGLPMMRPIPVQAQIKHEIGLQIVGATARGSNITVGPSLAWRVGHRDRLILHGGAGLEEDGGPAGRFEALWHFHLDPTAREKVGLYLGGGAGLVLGDESRGVLVATAGLEGNPGAGNGWIVELGAGGGLRVGVGYRWRWPVPARR